MQFTLVLSVVLVVLVVLMFLRTVRATIIAGVALPLSLIATFGVMWFCGFSLDNLSLMALTIGTGFVVDDAIVMIENIVRHIEDGESPLDAALRGAREIGFTVISLTLSLIAVFIPLLFMTGLVGRMFREFALTLTIAVVVSAIVSLTLTPMMCSRLLRHQAAQAGNARRPRSSTGRSIARSSTTAAAWNGCCATRRMTLLVTLATLAATVWLYIVMPKGFLPPQDTGLIFAVSEAGTEVSFAADAAAAGAGRGRDQEGPGRRRRRLGPRRQPDEPDAERRPPRHHACAPRDERRASVDDIVDRLKQAVGADPRHDRLFPAGAGHPDQHAREPRAVPVHAGRHRRRRGDRVVREARRRSCGGTAGCCDVASEAQEGGLRMQVQVDRETAGRLGVSMQAINDTLNDAFGQRQISTIYSQANQYRVILEAQPRYQQDPASLSKLYVTGASTSTGTTAVGRQHRRGHHQHQHLGDAQRHHRQQPGAALGLRALRAHLGAAGDRAPGAVSVGHHQLQPAARLGAERRGRRDRPQAQRAIGMPSSVTGSYSGDAAEFDKSLAGQPWLILAAAITIYIVLGVLYESLIHPITILSTLPSAGVGALLALMLFGYDLSVIALIGIVLLMGIVKKNAIMMIDFALEAERGQGMSPRDAIVQASLLRFRPIMMTTLAALFGALPLALESGTGSELRNPLGITIVGGLLLSQLLTLYTTPVIYLAMERLKQRFSRTQPFVPPVPRPDRDVPHAAAE